MSYEEEVECSTTHYHCIDPIENFKIKIVLQSVKNLYIPLPQFDLEQSLTNPSIHEESKFETEEILFKWQEKKFSKNEIKKYTDEVDWKKRIIEKYHDSIKDDINNLKSYSSKVFSYVEADNYTPRETDWDIFTQPCNFISSLNKKIKSLKISGPSFKNYKNVLKRKIINYYPTDEFKSQSHLISKNVQKMFIMIDLGSKIMENKSEQQEHYEGVLCCLTYDCSTCVLQITPSFSTSESKPYCIGMQNENGKNFYYYWIYHASQPIRSENLTKEVQLMTKAEFNCFQIFLSGGFVLKEFLLIFGLTVISTMIDYQEQVKKLQIDTEFFVGKPDYLYTTLLGEIISAQDFEYDNLHVHYFMKLPLNWGYSDIDSLFGRTQSCCKNSQGVCHFSHLFEMNFCSELNLFKDLSFTHLELFFEVLSIDQFKRYRNEGYAYISLPRTPGMFKYSLRCWRIYDRSITSELKRFFIGGGPELEDVSYIGLSTNEKSEVMSRFGLGTVPSGLIEVKLNILHQSKDFAVKTVEQTELERNLSNRLDAGSLLGSVNAVLEAFRRARERMLQAKKGLQTNFSFTFPEIRDNKKSN